MSIWSKFLKMSDKARRALTDYYAYMNRESNNYSSETITGKMVKGNVGGGNPGSTIPKGIKFTDPEFLKWINKMDLIVDYMAEHHRGAFEYVELYYSQGVMQKDIVVSSGLSKSTLDRLHKEAQAVIDVKL